MKMLIYSVLALGLLLSCSGIDDLIFDRHPQLSEFQTSSDRIAPFDTVFASVKATNPIEGALEYKWSIEPERGTFIGSTDLDSVRWIAPIQGGWYELKVRVDNTAKFSTQSKQIEVIVSERPVVDLRQPGMDAYFVIGQEINVEARAEHANGLSWIRIYLNEQLMAEQDQNDLGVYRFTVVADSSMVGKSLLKVAAKSAVVSDPGSDTIEIQIGGIIPGKNGN